MGNTHPVSPLRGWLGGKYRLAGTIIPLIPSDHTCYAEVFGGAAWVLFKKPPSKVEAINDINADVINLYRCVQNHLPELLRQAEYLLPSRDEYCRLQHCNPTTLTDIQRAVRFLYLHRMGFGGKVAEFCCAAASTRPPKFRADRLAEELQHSHRRLQGVMLERLNYDDFIARYDKPGTFFYIDPPYWDCETMYGKGIFAKADFERLAKQLRHIKGRFLLSINDVPAIREIFTGFQFKEVSLRYSINKEATTEADELLIANYPINTEQAEPA